MAGDGSHQTHGSGVPCTGAPGSLATSPSLRGQTVEALLESPGVRALGPSEGLEPLGDLLEALLARGLREAGIHLRVLVRLAGDGRPEVLHTVADRLAGHWVADALEVVEVAVGVAGLALRGVAEQAGEIRVTFDVGDLGEIEVTAVGL